MGMVNLEDQPPWLVINNPYKMSSVEGYAPGQQTADKRWMPEDIKRLIGMHYDNKSYKDMGNVLNRSVQGISRRLMILRKKGKL